MRKYRVVFTAEVEATDEDTANYLAWKAVLDCETDEQITDITNGELYQIQLVATPNQPGSDGL